MTTIYQAAKESGPKGQTERAKDVEQVSQDAAPTGAIENSPAGTAGFVKKLK